MKVPIRLPIGILGALLASACAMAPQLSQRAFNDQQAACADLAKDSAIVGRQCMYDLGDVYHVPVNCMTLFLDGKYEASQTCQAQAREMAKLENAKAQSNWDMERKRYALEHPVDPLAPLQDLAGKWARPVSAPARTAPECTPRSHIDGFGKPVTTTSCQ